MKNEARRRATQIVQREIPQYIAHLNSLIGAGSTDKSSPLWRGQLTHGAYVKENVKLVYQPSREDGAGNILSQHAPAIVIRGVDELSLTDVAKAKEHSDAMGDDLERPGMQWGGRLASNEVCDRLMDLVEE